MTRVCTAVIIGMVIRMEWSGGRHSICKQQSLLCLIRAQMMSVSTWTIHPVFWSHINFIHFSKCTCHYTVDCWRNFNKCLFLCVFTTDFCTLNWSRHSYEWDCLPGRSCTVSTPQPVMLCICGDSWLVCTARQIHELCQEKKPGSYIWNML